MQTFLFPRHFFPAGAWPLGLLFIIGHGIGFPTPSFAEVNLQDARFEKTWIDLPHFRRSYNSRSLHAGLFGMGWCTDFEKYLDFENPQTIHLRDCESSAATPAYADFHQIAAGLYRNVLGHTLLRSGGKFIHRKYSTDRDPPEEILQVFDLRGRLISLRQQNAKVSIELSYDEKNQASDRPRKIIFNQKYILRIHYDDGSRLIQRIDGSGGISSSYLYRRENLTEVRNAWNSRYRLRYDELQNLTRVDYPDKTFEEIHYDKDKDWVLTYQDRRKCLENYGYRQVTRPQPHVLSQIRRQCPHQKIQTAQIEFWYHTKTNSLKKVRITRHDPSLTPVQIINYDPI